MENKYFIKFIEHSVEFYELIRQRPTAFVLLSLIADRARKVPLDINDGIEVGEAFIGDYKEYCATPQSYRTDKKYLEKFKIVTFNTTNKGTIAKIVKSSIFNISRDSSTDRLTDKQQKIDKHITTKQEVRSEKEGRKKSKAKPMKKNDFSHESTSDNYLNPLTSAQYKNHVTENYWNLYAPAIADRIEVSEESLQYANAKRDWLKKAKVASISSVLAFLENANDWEDEDMSERY